MSKIRVHELAKELGKSSRDVIYALKGHGIDVESHMSTITSESADKIRKYFTSDKTAKPESKPVQAGDNGRGEQRMNQTGQRENSRQENAGRQGQDRAANRFSGRGNDTRSRDRSGVDNTRNADSNRGADNGRGEGRTDNSRGNDNNRGGRFNRDGQKNFGDRSGGQRNSGDRSGGRFNNERNRSNDGRGNDNNRGGRFNRDGQKNFGDRNNGERNNNDRNNNDRNNNRGNAGGRFSNNGDRGGRPFNNNNRDNRSAGARGRGDRDNKFNLDSAINKEVVVTKDTTRENRRSYKDSRDKDRNSRDRENDKKNSRGRNTSVAKKPLTPPVQKPKPVVEKVTNIVLPETITLKELGDKMKVPGAEIVKKLFMAGKLVSLNTEITYDEAEEIALDYDILCEHEVVVDVIEEMLRDEEDNEKDLVERPPVVCVMGPC